MCSEKKIKKECDNNGNDNYHEYENEVNDSETEACAASDEGMRKNMGCCQQLTDIQDKYAHVVADMQNFRHRVEKERMQWSTVAQTDIVKKILPVVDDFDRALQESTKFADQEQLVVGFSMIHKSLLKMLDAIGVEVMTDFATFDPEKHEAILQVDAPGHQSGDIVDVLEKGYLFKHEVIRPAKVSVAR